MHKRRSSADSDLTRKLKEQPYEREGERISGGYTARRHPFLFAAPPSAFSSFSPSNRLSPVAFPSPLASMFALSLLTLAFAASAAFAVPAMKRTSPSCTNLGGGAFDNAKTFTLAAYNTSLPNANTTGVPLVLGQAGAISGVSFKVLSVRVHADTRLVRG